MKIRIYYYLLIVYLFASFSFITGCKSENTDQPDDRLMTEGINKFDNGEIKEARDIFRKVTLRDNDNIKAKIKLASADLYLNLDNTAFTDSLYTATRFNIKLKDLVSANYSMASQSEVIEKYDKAKDNLNRITNEIEAFTNAINKKPNDARLFFGRGCWKYLLKDKEGAIGDFTAAVNLDNNFYQAYQMLGRSYRTYMIGGKFREFKEEYFHALFNFIKADQLHPNDPSVLQELVDLYKYFGLSREADETNSRILAISK